MHRRQLFVILARATLAENPSDVVTVVARVGKRRRHQVFVFLIAEQPVLRFPENRPGFFGRKAVAVT
jgi:hypothetical protein